MADTFKMLKSKQVTTGGSQQQRPPELSPVKVLPDDGLVESRGLLELVLLHEEHVSHIQFPDVRLVAELDRLPEQLLNLLKKKSSLRTRARL